MPDIKNAMILLVNIFDKYAKKDGDNRTLSKAELKELLQDEFEDVKEKANDKVKFDDIFNDLDMNGDNTVDFSEFVTLLARLALACHECLCKRK